MQSRDVAPLSLDYFTIAYFIRYCLLFVFVFCFLFLQDPLSETSDGKVNITLYNHFVIKFELRFCGQATETHSIHVVQVFHNGTRFHFYFCFYFFKGMNQMTQLVG